MASSVTNFFTNRFKTLVSTRKSGCKQCGAEIQKGELKIQYYYKGSMVSSWHSYHPECMFKRLTPRMSVVIRREEDIGGYDDLEGKHQGYISALIKTYLPKYTSDKNTPAQAKESKEKKDESSSSATGSEMPKKGNVKKGQKKKAEEEVDPVPCKKGKKAEPPKKKAEPPKKKAEPAKKKAEPAKKKAEPKPTPKKAKKRVRVIESSESSSAEEDVVVAAPAKKTTSATQTTDKKTLSDDAKQEFYDLHCRVQSGDKLTVADFSQFTVNELKLAIKMNDRSTTGNKTDLAKNLVDYMTNGCPPRCPECGGGRLKTRTAGGKTEYYCPGYMEDDEFLNCAYKIDWIARIPWKSP